MVVRRLSLSVPPTEEPIGLDEARRAVRRFDGDEDVDLVELIAEARDYVEAGTNLQLMPATWVMTLSGIPCEGWIEVPRPPLQAGSVAVEYYDQAGALQTLATSVYAVLASTGPRTSRGRIVLKPGQTWPTLEDREDALRVTFVAGYANAAAVPPALRRAIKLLVGHWYRQREAAVVGIQRPIPIGVTAILPKFRSCDGQRVAA